MMSVSEKNVNGTDVGVRESCIECCFIIRITFMMLAPKDQPKAGLQCKCSPNTEQLTRPAPKRFQSKQTGRAQSEGKNIISAILGKGK